MSEEFEPQTITLNLSPYNFVIIYYLFSAAYFRYNEEILKVGLAGRCTGHYQYTAFRGASTSISGVVFTNGIEYREYGSYTETYNNNIMIPSIIYCIK